MVSEGSGKGGKVEEDLITPYEEKQKVPMVNEAKTWEFQFRKF